MPSILSNIKYYSVLLSTKDESDIIQAAQNEIKSFFPSCLCNSVILGILYRLPLLQIKYYKSFLKITPFVFQKVKF